ncbi:MAG TPA: penicillin-binding protein activator LpoB [Myxococcales bacterium]|nr:penicillin-binding protein activator LpoB [Myxococcales bacterium]
MRIDTTFNIAVALALAAGCSHGSQYKDKAMDFAAVRTVAVLPFQNLSATPAGGERTREVFSELLFASGAVYVLPSGEVARGIGKANLGNPTAPSAEDVVNLGKALAAQAVITGTVKEYGETRSGSSTGTVISVSVQMLETSSGKVVWQASTTRGGIGFWTRLVGGGGDPMNNVTEDAVRDLLGKLFK